MTFLSTEEFKGVESDILFDQGDYVKLAIGNIGQSLILGGIFAMLVLFFFLRGIKSPTHYWDCHSLFGYRDICSYVLCGFLT